MRRFLWLLLGCSVTLSGFAQSSPVVTVEGTVQAVVMDQVKVGLSDGSTKIVTLPAQALVTKRVRIDWKDIRTGDWVGIDSQPGADGRQVSVAINIFSPAIIARVRKGHFVMESGDLMTNAPVAQVNPEADGGSLVLKDADAMVGFRVDAKTVVHRLVDGSASDVKPRLHITVRGAPHDDGTVTAVFVTVDQP